MLSVYKAVSFTVYVHVRYSVHMKHCCIYGGNVTAVVSLPELLILKKNWLKSETLRKKSAWIGIVV